MREYTITRPGHPGIVADDETILLEIRRIGAGTFTLIVDVIDEDETCGECGHAVETDDVGSKTCPSCGLGW